MRRSIPLFILILFCVVSFAQNGKPVIGISLDKHTSPVVFSCPDIAHDRLATLAQDRTLRIWTYSSHSPLDVIHLPEDPDSVGEFCECAFHPLQDNVIIVAENMLGQSLLFVVDLLDHQILQTSVFRGENIGEIRFSPDGSMMLVRSFSDYMALYDSIKMTRLWDVSYLDENICNVAFLSGSELLVVTDLYARMYDMKPSLDGSFDSMKESHRKRLPYLLDGSIASYLSVDEGSRMVYLSQIQKKNTLLMSFDASSLRRGEKKRFKSDPSSVFVMLDWLKGVSADGLSDPYYHVSDLCYRKEPAPRIEYVKDTLYIRYPDEPLWALTPTGLSRCDSLARMPKEKTVRKAERLVLESLYFPVRIGTGILSRSRVIRFTGRHVVCEDWDFHYYDRVSPARVSGIDNWFNEDYFVLSLEDGTIRIMESDTGREAMGLFIGKDGEWIMWKPDGVFVADSMDHFNMIEWRYQWFGQVEVRKPYQERGKYCKPGYFARYLKEMSSGETNGTVVDEDVHFTIQSVEREGPHVQIRYSLNGYNPFLYGPYHIHLEVDETPSSSYVDTPSSDGGVLDMTLPQGFSRVDLILMTENNQWLAFDSYIPNEEKAVTGIRFLSVGVSDYQGTGMPSLIACASDANDFAEVMKRVKCPVDAESTVLTNSMATCDRIRESFGKMLEDAEPGRLSVLYLSGHGVQGLYDHFLFVPGSDGGERKRLDVSALLSEWPEKAGPLLVIVDACNSGLLARTVSPNVAIMASSGWDQESRDGNIISNSLFTSAVIHQIESVRTSGEIRTLDVFYQEIGREVNRTSGGRQAPVFCQGSFFNEFNLEVL